VTVDDLDFIMEQIRLPTRRERNRHLGTVSLGYVGRVELDPMPAGLCTTR
jgi:hypothetical protein